MDLKDYEKWKEEKNKEAYQAFLEEFGITDEKLRKIIKNDYRYILDLPDFFFGFYNKPEFSFEQGETMAENKPLKKTDRESFMAFFFNQIIEIEIKKFAKLYNLDWEELRQESAIKFIEIRGKYDIRRGANLLTFYKVLIRRKAIDLARKKRKETCFSIDKTIDERLSCFDQIKDIDLENAIKELTQKQQEAIKLIFFKGYTQEEAAHILNIKQQSFNDRLNNAFKKLKKYL